MTESTDHLVLDALLQNLQEDGYEVFSHPRRNIIPKFMGNYIPDAIAIKGGSKKAIELVRSGPASAAKVDHIKKVFFGHDDWELQVVYVNPASTNSEIHLSNLDTIVESIDTVENLIRHRFGVAAILQAWSTFEASARLLDPETFSRPQSPGKLLDAMASAGHVTPDEADVLRTLSKLLNQVAHGDLDVEIPYNDLGKMIDITNTVLNEFKRLSPQSAF